MADNPDFFRNKDPWGYATNPCDQHRRKIFLSLLQAFGPFDRALDLGACEGWISTLLPATVKHGYEISDEAAARFPSNVTRVLTPQGKYDLVVATGVLYTQYDWPSMVELIQDHASGIILVSGIKDWENQDAINAIPGRQVLIAEFPYREYEQRLRIFSMEPK